MTYLLFLDESGQDQRNSPFEVLAGIAFSADRLWPLVQAIQQSEIRHFGQRYAAGERELKATKLLKTKTFRLARQLPPFQPADRTELARRCLGDGPSATCDQMTALAQAKLAFSADVLRIARAFGGAAFASMIPRSAPRSSSGFLRKDYAFLFERYFYFLEDHGDATGLIVFDELDRAQSHLLVDQMHHYFLGTRSGNTRSRLVVPEPFFVHSELTTGVQIADLLAYVIAWSVRLSGQVEPARAEMQEMADLAVALRHDTSRTVKRRRDFRVYGFARIGDLRPLTEQELDLPSEESVN